MQFSRDSQQLILLFPHLMIMTQPAPAQGPLLLYTRTCTRDVHVSRSLTRAWTQHGLSEQSVPGETLSAAG